MYYTAVGLESVTDREQTNTQRTDRESNYRGHSNRRWIVGLSGPILRGDFKDREQTLPVGGFVQN